ncbi:MULTISPECIES: ABC transporter substrate-binding protein [Ensifer]|jgi:iron(III) transport system substrate-binding protein|uniref:ABC transporter substrate-binding protein n=2 Tax=Sinorhizobium/Ensifer group TaxID=227292 RepID=UPI0009EBA80B|nr:MULTISPECIES: ABC transporter substrate-binding protein [Ensifer]MBD9497289.1 ABC transporter substrate-binding protein [Ensifer sp. ENS01]MBW0367208.1 ABC transporter substrate-binding protein [Ensifer adhaerens]UCM23562.1 ABC transporter substrate-binding protein [Ensifer adhaerens]
MSKGKNRVMIMGAAFAALAAALAVEANAEEAFDLNALVEAAKKEKPINVYDSTGKIVEMAEAFTAKYGVKATGVKVSANSQLEMIIREAQAGNVQGDVALITDAPAALAQLLPQGFVESYLPGDMKEKIPAAFQNPLAISTNANVWAYNTEAYDKCPVGNIWELTEAKWKGKIALVDPLTKSTYTDWFNQLEKHADNAVKEAYKVHFGKDLETAEKSAAAAWIKALAQNGPLVTDGDDPVAEAVGAAGQKEPFFGLLSSAKFRDNEGKGYKLGLCTELTPWVGWTYTKLGLIASKSASPNAAKLFIHYVLTEEGIAPQMKDGKLPTNVDIKMPEDEPSGIMEVADRLFPYDAATGLDDFDRREEWQDFWRMNYSK